MKALRTAYCVVLPVAFPQFQAVIGGPALAEPVLQPNLNIRPRVLVVDDKAKDLETISNLLEPSCALLVAGPARPEDHALEIWEQHPELRLALVDLRMPDRHGVLSVDVGFELIEKLRKRPGAVIMIYSGVAGESVQARAKALGIADFVRKEELNLDELVAQLQSLARLQAEEPELNHNWALSSHEVLRKYAGQVVAVYDCEVVASGSDHLEALGNALARPGCPDRDKLAFVAVPSQPWFESGFFSSTAETIPVSLP